MSGIARGLLISLVLAAACASGCGRRAQPPPEPAPPKPEVSALTMGGSVITVVDPQGRWKFEARSPHVEADGLEGPFRLAPAECRYQERGRSPVLMTAEEAQVDKAAQRVLLTGKVRITYGTLSLAADRVEYDLQQGKVVAR